MASGRIVVSPPAVELWEDVKVAARTLLASKSDGSYLFEVVCANAVLGMVVTGFETYCKKRFGEIEAEGVLPDGPSFLARFGTAEERSKLRDGSLPAALKRAPTAKEPLAPTLARRVNFQDYAKCKQAFSRAYGIRFGIDLGLPSQLLQRVQRILAYRHRIVHVSPMLSMLNQAEVPAEQPEFSNRAMANATLSLFDELLRALHRAT